MFSRRTQGVKRLAVLLVLATTAAGCGCAAAATPEPPAVLVVGDSNTLGDSWVQKMGANCRPAVWAWSGVGVFTGTIGAGAINDLTGKVMTTRPRSHVVIMLGTNDVLMSQPNPTVAQLNQVAANFRNNGAASVRWATIPPLGSSMPAAHLSAIDAWNRTILKTPNAIDLRSALGSTLDPAEHQGDGIHLSPRAHSTLAKTAARSSIC